eukprot:gene4318-3132_t
MCINLKGYFIRNDIKKLNQWDTKRCKPLILILFYFIFRHSEKTDN